MYWELRTRLKLFLGKGVFTSYAQFGEDMIVNSLLRNLRNGLYVDVGAFDPVLYSTTYHFYTKGWKGIVIDPNPSLKRRFKSFRPRDRFVLAGVGEASEKTYFEFNDASYNTFSKEEADKYLAKIGDKNIRLISKSLRPIKTLAEILQGVDSIDYLNIDVQGMDLEVLQSYDWNCYPKVISIEDENFTLENPGQIYSYLCGKGYALMGVSQLTLIFKKI